MMEAGCVFVQAALLLFLLPVPVALPAIVYVDDDNTAGPWVGSAQHPFQRVQDGLQAAVHGDTVLVLPGTYTETIDFLGKAVHVRSDSGPEVTILDGDQRGSVVMFVSQEGSGSVLDGFTITNGSAVNGGGIRCNDSSPTIRNNRIISNYASMSGGGIMSMYGSPIILDNLLQGNDCGWGGGAMNLKVGQAVVCFNDVLDNTAAKRGGGIRTSESYVLIWNNVVSGNRSPYGGGLSCGSDLVFGNAIFGNVADEYGGGVFFSNAAPVFGNNTIAYNQALIGGGGLCCGSSGSASVVNTILWENHAPVGSEVWIGTTAEQSYLEFLYSDVKGGQGSVATEAGCTYDWGLGMIATHPLFAGREDLRLWGGSPCVDAGLDAALPSDVIDLDEDGDVNEPVPSDVLGGKRQRDGNRDGASRVDLGAYECNPDWSFTLRRLYTGAVPGSPLP